MTNPNFQPDDAPEIMVDEDWKSQVEREKETLRNKDKGEHPRKTARGRSAEMHGPPPASFEGLVSLLTSQAMASLGLLPDPESGEAKPDRFLAKFLIDTLDILETKTNGNLTEIEQVHIRDALHHLRMIYVAAPASPKTSLDAPEEKTEGPTIVLP